MESHFILEGKVRLYKRGKGPKASWNCSTYIGSREERKSTGEDSLARAKEVAEDWFWNLRDKNRRGELIRERTFADVVPVYMREFVLLTQGKRSPVYVNGHFTRLNKHLIPYFGSKGLSQINGGTVQEYRIHRIETSPAEKPPARSTLHQELVVLRQVLKTAIRHKWLDHLPDLSFPFRVETKVSHRAWFSPEEYKQLYEATRERAKHPTKSRWKWACEQLHDYVLFMANTGLRPDEAKRLEHRDVQVVKDADSGETILHISVQGKRGTGYCKSTASAVKPYLRLKNRPAPPPTQQPRYERLPGVTTVRTLTVNGKAQEITSVHPTASQSGILYERSEGTLPKPTDRVFPGSQHELFDNILEELNLKIDRQGKRRTAYSLRHTYICMRLLEGADIYDIAKNCRTSVEMIQKHYASHIISTLNAARINVRRPKPRKADRQSLGDDE